MYNIRDVSWMLKSMSIHQRDSNGTTKSNFITSYLTFKVSITTCTVEIAYSVIALILCTKERGGWAYSKPTRLIMHWEETNLCINKSALNKKESMHVMKIVYWGELKGVRKERKPRVMCLIDTQEQTMHLGNAHTNFTPE